MDLSFIADIFTSGGLGGIIGAVGGWVQKREERKAAKEQYEYDLKMGELDLKSQHLEQKHQLAIADKQIDIAEAEGEIEVEKREVDAFVASQQNQDNSGAIRWVRPIITGYLLILATTVAVNIHLAIGGLESIPEAEKVTLYRDIINSVFFLTTTATLWWFAARGPSKK